MGKKILHLTLKKKWFDLIAQEKKKIEYREIKPYWNKRLTDEIPNNDLILRKQFDEIHFKNGYSKDAPFMRVEWLGMGTDIFEEKDCYAIHLGKILEIKNYPKQSPDTLEDQKNE